MSSSALAGMSAGALAKAIRQGEISAVEATSAAIRRAADANPTLNAVLALDADQALTRARQIDALPADDPQRAAPLLGVPLAHKDMFDHEGKIASWGAKIRAARPAKADATVIARLNAAGAVHFGHLNMAEFAFGITGHNYQVGHCHNPRNPAYITGGSSSGSAASVAAGLVPFALGSDTGGSVRVPSACCGIVGLRPTWGLISRAGAMPLASSLDTVGPLARDIADIALVLSLLAGADPADGMAQAPAGVDYLAALDQPAAGLKVGVDRALLEDIAPEIAVLLENAQGVLEECGITFVDVRVPNLAQLDQFAQLLQFAEASAVHATWMRERPQDYSPQVRKRLEDGYAVTACDYLQAVRARPLVVREWLSGPFAGVDVLFLPTLGRMVPTIAETDVGGGATMAEMIAALLRFTRPLSYLGMPSLSLPTGRDSHGLPNGFQIVGRPYAETTLLKIGAAYQKCVGTPALDFGA